MAYFNFNGKIMSEGTLVAGPDNRGLRYGDGLFETMKFAHNNIILLDEHLARLWKGMQLLKFDIPKLFTPDLVASQIHETLTRNKLSSARIRLSVFRGDGGLYDAKNNAPQYIVQAWPLDAARPGLNTNGLQLCIYEDAKKPIDAFSNLKHNNFLPYVMGALFAKELKANDAVILNSLNNVCESTIANIFIVKDRTIYTPPLSEGCIAGVMRKFILQNHNPVFEFREQPISKEVLLDADEVFLTNSITNMKWVAAIGEKKYTHTITAQLFESLVKTNPDVFC